MRIVIIASGTRGDVQPGIALAKGFTAAGHTVAIAAGSDFADDLRELNVPFEDLNVNIKEVMSGEIGRKWVESSQWEASKYMREAFLSAADPMVSSLIEIIPRYDVVIAGLTTLIFARVIADHFHKPIFHLALQPAYPTKSGAGNMIAFLPQADSFINRLIFPIMMRVMWNTGGEGVKLALQKLGSGKYGYRDSVRDYAATPTVIAVSPQVSPHAADYPDHVTVSGFLFLDSPDWSPGDNLQAFLDAGEVPVYVGFGSMTGGNSGETVRLITEALDGHRAIINRGWAGLDADSLPDTVHLIDGAPHDKLFPLMGAVVHHGGAGTTAAGLRAGIPTLIVPHMADQPYFGRRVYDVGAGPKPIPRKKLTMERLREGIDTALTDASIRARAQEIGQAIRAEDGVSNAVQWILSRLNQP